MMRLDDVIPEPRYRLFQHRLVSAPPDVVWEELHRVTMASLPLGRALEGARLLPARIAGRSVPALGPRSFLDVMPIPTLFSDGPNVEIAAGLSQAWRLLGGPTPPDLDAVALREWDQPGWIKVGMEYRLEAVSSGTLVSIDTRVVAVDSKTQRVFSIYWFVIRASSAAIRREFLRTIARRAESVVARLSDIDEGCGR
jgi:hypothetical protein